MRTKVIIGLMGGDQQPTEARRIGVAVAQLEQILLTGAPIGDNNSQSVHRAAMHAAWLTRKARLIGILPRQTACSGADNLCRERRSFEAIQGANGFYFHTGLDSEERDSVTGLTPDILIFLRGSAGTLCELAYAAVAGRKTYFIDCVHFLLTKLKASASTIKIDQTFAKAQRHCSSINGRFISVGELKAQAAERLATAEDWGGTLPDLVSEVATMARSGGLAKETGFPFCMAQDHKMEFERRVLEMG
jgi:predicted Rossmann-fold nucleotide-binding protein